MVCFRLIIIFISEFLKESNNILVTFYTHTLMYPAWKQPVCLSWNRIGRLCGADLLEPFSLLSVILSSLEKKGSRLKPNNCYLNEMLKKTAIKEFVFKHKPQTELFSISLKYSDTKSMITVFVVTQVKICLFCTSDFYFSSQSLNILFLHLI